MKKSWFRFFILVTLIWTSQVYSARPIKKGSINLDKDKVLYMVGYAHLDTQWNWTYKKTIDKYIKKTLDDNFSLFRKYKDYSFNFTGSVRYEMMKEYYPKKYKKLKKYIKKGRWFVSGSSVDEGDVNVPSSESLIRQVLYGNDYFRKEFGKESVDFMLPDCFGFPASMPSIWAHTGLLGFSTQKLTWGSAVGIPFNIGVWEGPDGKSVISALNPGAYVSHVKKSPAMDKHWVKRVEDNGEKYGVYADYRYYGVGDRGGAPRKKDVKKVTRSMKNKRGKIKIVSGSSDQMYKDITPAQKARLPRYKGDLLLTEHSSGTLSSKAHMKRWNRKNELLADSAERASILARWLGGAIYPLEKINKSWIRVLASQMHDILPGTSIPKAYEFSYNDEIIGLNGFANALKGAIGASAKAMDTRVIGKPILVYNPLSIERRDLVKAVVPFEKTPPKSLRVFNNQNQEIPSQILKRNANSLELIFLANVPPVGLKVFDLRESEKDYGESNKSLQISKNNLESDQFRISINDNGDIVSILDKKNEGKEILSGPIRLAFLKEYPRDYPSWNMDWNDRKKPPYAYVDGPVKLRIVENGPLRVSLEVERKAQGSIFVQRIRLTKGSRRIEFDSSFDWLSKNSSLKASFPFVVSNPMATYNMGLGTIQRGNNTPRKYEVPSHQWFDLSQPDGSYGVSILEDGKFGSDKPNDHTLRLTLLFTPNTKSGGFHHEATQDWGHHDFIYAIYPHKGDWREAKSEWQGARLNQPLVAFETSKHSGFLGKSYSFLNVNTPQVAVRALKKEENGNKIILRLQEIWGKEAKKVTVTFTNPIETAMEVDGQERKIGMANIENGKLVIDMTKFSPRTFAIKLQSSLINLNLPKSRPLNLKYNLDVTSFDGKRSASGMDFSKSNFPGEIWKRKITSEGIRFKLGSPKGLRKNAIQSDGQTIKLPRGNKFNRLYVLAAANDDTEGVFRFLTDNGVVEKNLKIQNWQGFVGMFDNRNWGLLHKVKSITPGFIKRDNIAWFGTHTHNKKGRNIAYNFCYMYKYGLDIPADAKELILPKNGNIKIFAITAADDPSAETRPLVSLYDNFDNRKVVQP